MERTAISPLRLHASLAESLAMRRALTAILSTTIGFTACAGGVFAIPIGLAAQADRGDSRATIATPALDGDTTCLSYSPSSRNDDDAMRSDDAGGGCGDGRTCLNQNGASARDLTTTYDVVSGRLLVAAHRATIAINDLQNPLPDAASRDGPLFPDARRNAHALKKRE